MKIALVRPNYPSHIITPPLGLGYLASFLKSKGIKTIIIDGLREKLDNQAVLKKIIELKPNAVGLTCLTAFYNQTIDLSRLFKENGILVIIGGVHPTFLPYQTLVESGADYVICGEAEISLAKLAKNNFINNDIKGVYSLANLKDSNQPIIKSEVVENLDDLSFPDWAQIDPNKYPRAPHGALAKNFPIGIIMTSRGCPYECTFCASPKFYDRKIRFRSPENVIQEIEYLVKNFGIKEIHFEDDNLTLVRERVEKLCNLIIEKGIKISWACPNGIRADKVDRELIKLMARSGCYRFVYGIESANSDILRRIRKHETIGQINEAIDIADSEGINCQGFFILGLPGETEATMEESINFARSSKLSGAQFCVLDILPGSELWDELRGKFAPDWSKDSFKEPEWIPKGLSKEKIMSAQSRAFRQFYFRPKIIIKMLKLINFKQLAYILKRIKDYRLLGSN